MQLLENIDLFSIPVEMYAGSGGNRSIRKTLLSRAAKWLGQSSDSEADEERQLELEAILAAKQAAKEGDFQKEERILSQYAEAANKRKAERSGNRTETQIHGNVGLLKRALSGRVS